MGQELPEDDDYYEDNYINSLLDAQERGEIKNLRFEANQQGLRATFTFSGCTLTNFIPL